MHKKDPNHTEHLLHYLNRRYISPLTKLEHVFVKKIYCCFRIVSNFEARSQEDGVILVIPSADSKIFIDGLEKGISKSGSSVRIRTSAGEHYIESQPVDPKLQTKGEVVVLESNKQKGFEGTVRSAFNCCH